MPTALLPSAALVEYYRFALLLTGDAKAAEQILADTLLRAQAQLPQLRRQNSRTAWLALRIRERCLLWNTGAAGRAESELAAGAVVGPERWPLVQHFQSLPEPERSALALFYLNFFSAGEIAQLLQMKLEGLSETLGAARQLLRQAVSAGEVAVGTDLR